MPHKIKVVQYCPTGPLAKGWFGGVDMVVLQLMRVLDRDRFDVSALVNCEGCLSEECERANLVCRVVPRGRHLSPKFIFASAAYLRTVSPDIVHVHGMSAGTFYGYAAARLAQVPRIVLTIHSFSRDEELRPLLSLLANETLDRIVLRGIDFMYTVATCQMEDPILRGITRDKLCAIPNGIEITPMPPSTGSEVRAEFGIAADELILITVTRLSQEKGTQYLLPAAAAAIQTRPNLRFLIVGEGPQREELLALRASLGLEDKVIFTGFRRDVTRLLAGSDVFVLPSMYEGMPIAVLESMRAGLPTVATAVKGVPELVGDTGILVPRKNPGALAAGMIEMTADVTHMRELGRLSRKRIEEQFSVEEMARKVGHVYELVLRDRHH